VHRLLYDALDEVLYIVQSDSDLCRAYSADFVTSYDRIRFNLTEMFSMAKMSPITAVWQRTPTRLSFGSHYVSAGLN